MPSPAPVKLFPQDVTFAVGEVGFNNEDENGRPYDLLGRKAVGQRLTDLVERVQQPLVIALDGGWGSGKSHFLKLWTGEHNKNADTKAKVIYFDAFAHDYLDDPLVSLVARLTTPEAESSWGAAALSAVKKAAFPLVKLGLRAVAAAATAGLTEIAGSAADAALNKAGEATQATIDSFWERETGRIAAMQQFREALTALTAPAAEGGAPRKLVFIIDELDRCRPDYALTLLEIVKHFFSVPNVHFVLGVNMEQLEKSVKARYGAETNAKEYLMKFVHVRMTFPVVRDRDGNEVWAKYFDAILEGIGQGPRTLQDLRLNLSIHAQTTPISLRDVERIAGRLCLLPKKIEGERQGALRMLATSALIIQVLRPLEFALLRSGRFGLDQFLEIYPHVPADSDLSHHYHCLSHTWRVVCLDNPGDEARAIVGRAFDGLRYTSRKVFFDNVWSDLFDTFQLVGDT